MTPQQYQSDAIREPDDSDYEPSCATCGGDGFVDAALCEEQLDVCPNCGGSGLRRHCKTF